MGWRILVLIYESDVWVVGVNDIDNYNVDETEGTGVHYNSHRRGHFGGFLTFC